MAEPARQIYDDDEGDRQLSARERARRKGWEHGSQAEAEDGEAPDNVVSLDDRRASKEAAGEDDSDSGSLKELKDAEKKAAEGSSETAESEPGTIGQGYKPDDKDKRGAIRGLIKNNKRKLTIVGGVAGAGAVISLVLFFLALPFKLTHFMENVQAKAFARYQVDMNGRSSKWIRSYMVLRFGEVEDPNVAPKDRENIYFRSNRVDTNRQMTDWYRTMRASKFEQEVWEKHGIRFTSVAYKKGNDTLFRPGVLTLVDDGNKQLTFKPSQDVFDAIERGDVNYFNGALRDFVEVDVLKNDKAARQRISELLKKERPGWWRAYTRFHIRRDIQNMIGVRNWRFFETTRDKIREKRISIRNKIIVRSFPDSNKAGRIIQCLFGITECRASTDAADPKNQSLPDSGTKKADDKTGDVDENPDTPDGTYGDGSAEEIVEDGIRVVATEAGEEAAEEVAERSVSKLINKQLLSKLNIATSIASFMDMFARLDKAISGNILTKLVASSKAAQAAGLYTVFAIANDQMRSGELTPEEADAFMDEFGNPTNNEAWATVISPQASNVASAATSSSTYTAAKDKEEFCSPEHQAEMEKPENRAKAEKEFQYLCPEDKVGDDGTLAARIERWWKNGPGKYLGPLFKVYNVTVGPIFRVFEAVVGAVLDPVVQGAIKLFGLENDIKDVVAKAAEESSKKLGATPCINENSPSGQVANCVMQGAAVTSESSMRMKGAATTTDESRETAIKNYLAFKQENDSSFFERYLSLDNHESLASRQVFAFSNLSLSSLVSSFGNMLGRVLSSPLKIFSLRTGAASDDPYAAANFAGIETFDLPDECLNSDPLIMLPKDATNADDLGYMSDTELDWDLLTDYGDWYAKLYEKVGDDENKAKKVWNCALFDDAVRGSLGAKYGYKGVNALSAASAATNSTSQQTGSDESGLTYPPNLGKPNDSDLSQNVYYQMPEPASGEYIFYEGTCERERWGNKKLTGFLYTVAVKWKAKHPSNLLKIGDLNANNGEHNTHLYGVGVDLYTQTGSANLTYADNYNRDEAIELGKMMLDTRLIADIWFHDQKVIDTLKQYAKDKDLPYDNMRIEYKSGSTAHNNHFHVNIDDTHGPTPPYKDACGGSS